MVNWRCLWDFTVWTYLARANWRWFSFRRQSLVLEISCRYKIKGKISWKMPYCWSPLRVSEFQFYLAEHIEVKTVFAWKSWRVESHQPSHWAVPKGHTQSQWLRLMIIFYDVELGTSSLMGASVIYRITSGWSWLVKPEL